MVGESNKNPNMDTAKNLNKNRTTDKEEPSLFKGFLTYNRPAYSNPNAITGSNVHHGYDINISVITSSGYQI